MCVIDDDENFFDELCSICSSVLVLIVVSVNMWEINKVKEKLDSYFFG